MTNPLDSLPGVGKVKELGKNSSRGALFKREKNKTSHQEEEGDNVEISEEAKNRASGKKRGNILEYLRNKGD